MHMRNILILTTAIALLGACSDKSGHDKNQTTSSTPQTHSPVQTEQTIAADQELQNQDAQLSAWFEEQFMETVRQYPQSLTMLGMKERMNEWNDPSRRFDLEELARTRQTLAELRANFDRDKLSPAMQLSYDLFVREAEQYIEDDQWHTYTYTFNQMFGAQSTIPTFLINNHRITSLADARAYIDRLNGVQAYLNGIIENSKTSADQGIMPPKLVYDHVIRDSKNVLSGSPFEDTDTLNLLLEDFQTKVDKLGLDAETRETLYADAIEALQTSVGPTYETLITVLEEQKAQATTDDGVWKLPKGASYYANRLNRMTTTDMSASEIHELGLSEVARIHEEMRAIMKKVGFEGTLQEFFIFMKNDPQFYYPNTDQGRDAYITKATALIETMKTRLPEMFNRQPKADLIVKRVEPFREKSAGKAFYNRPAPDGSRPGIYYANLYDTANMPKYQMEALAYHEGIPGHHMQLAISQELEGIPKFQRYGSVTAFSEGWGLYSEYLTKEMGFYQDPYSDFGRLAMEIWRAARLVVDTGIHDKQWSREQAIDYLLENTPNPEGDVVKAIERYIVMPGQATAYKIGMIKILELREQAKSQLGERFDIKAFHDVVLASGPVPLDILEQRVNDWVQSQP